MLAAARQNERQHPLAALWPAAYNDLRRVAARVLVRERPDHTLTPTALVHEVWLSLNDAGRPPAVRDRHHFMALAARVMRNILVNHAKARLADKRGNGAFHCTLSAADELNPSPAADSAAELLGVHQALQALAAIDPRAAEVAELKVFGGLEVPEIASALGVSEPTVKRDWVFARAQLAQLMR